MVVSKKLKTALIIGLLTPSLVAGPVLAQTETETTESTTSTTLQERLSQRKEALKTKLTSAQQSRLRSRCKATQSLISVYKTRVEKLETNRTETYTKVIDRLNNVIEKVGDRADTNALKKATETLQEKTDAFTASLAAYKQNTSDLVEMDCLSDPTAFQASLDSLRAERAKLATDSSEIRTYIKDYVQPLVQSLRIALKEGASK